jgi:hypothetical protein
MSQHWPVGQVLDQLGRMFDPLLRQNGLQWDAIPDAAQKRDIALQILAQVPVLWPGWCLAWVSLPMR